MPSIFRFIMNNPICDSVVCDLGFTESCPSLCFSSNLMHSMYVFHPPLASRDQPCLSVTRTTRWRWSTPRSRSTRTSPNTTTTWRRSWLLPCTSGWGASRHPADLPWMMSSRLGLITQVKTKAAFRRNMPSALPHRARLMAAAALWEAANSFLHCDLAKGINHETHLQTYGEQKHRHPPLNGSPLSERITQLQRKR